MDKGDRWVTVDGVAKELNTTTKQQLFKQQQLFEMYLVIFKIRYILIK